MENDILGNVTEETKEKMKEFSEKDEQEAYFLLCEIFAYAQATKDYARFQSDLANWKKRYPIELFSESYKIKIKYMLSKEFLDTVLKNFIAFDELSKKDPAEGLAKLRKILNRAEKDKDEKKLDKDLDELYKEFPLKFLKEKYPHLVGQLLSKANRTRILQKFDSALAYKELLTITENPNNFNDANEFTAAIEEWKTLFPTDDFNDKYRSDVEKTLTETLDSRKLEELFPITASLDLNLGEVIPLDLQDSLKDISLVSKDALHDFFKIVNKNKGDISGLFDWICKYNRYINSFDGSIKSEIVNSLMDKYARELPSATTIFRIPEMEAGKDDLISLSEFNSMNDIKKQVVLQLLGILSNEKELTHDDIYRLSIIETNAKKAKTIEKAKMEPKTELFVEKFPEEELTPSDDIYLESLYDSSIKVEFKNKIKVNTPIESITRLSGSSGTSDSGNNGGGWSSSIALNTEENTKTTEEESTPDDEEKKEKEEETAKPTSIQAVVLESTPEHKITKIETDDGTKENINTIENEPNTDISDNSGQDEIEPIAEVEEPETTGKQNPLKTFFNRFITRNDDNDARDDR